MCRKRFTILLLFFVCSVLFAFGAESPRQDFPRPLESYGQQPAADLWGELLHRVQVEPFNLAATAIFFLAIVHTFLAPRFTRWAHHLEIKHQQELRNRPGPSPTGKDEASFQVEILHFFGEVEAIFGIWVVPLLVALIWLKSWSTAKDYLDHKLDFTEPLFVMVIMTIAASRPVFELARRLMTHVANLGGGSPAAWWLSILTFGPLLGSFITEPAAMTISALLLAERFYEQRPNIKFAYATLGLLFVNVSVGGTLTHFAAPPVLMVAGKWGWGVGHMLSEFGWKAAIGIVAANAAYLFWFRKEFKHLTLYSPGSQTSDTHRVPLWIVIVHLLFLCWTVLNNHYPVLFLGGFLFYLAFTQATQHFQSELNLRTLLLVAFFLAGLVVHGGLQGWWIEPVLSRLSEVPLFLSAVGLTAFNDNAAITYLAALVPSFSANLQYAVVAGAVTGGGLTVIANAPNPAGQSILSKYFPDGISPLYLFFGAAVPTFIIALFFLAFRGA